MYDFIDRRVDSLDHGSRFLIWSMRSWVKAFAGRRCPTATIGPAFVKWHLIGALPHFHMAMMILNRDAIQTVRFAPLDCAFVCEDEAVMLALIRSLEAPFGEKAQATLALIVEKESIRALLVALSALTEDLSHAGLTPDPPAGLSKGMISPRNTSE